MKKKRQKYSYTTNNAMLQNDVADRLFLLNTLNILRFGVCLRGCLYTL